MAISVTQTKNATPGAGVITLSVTLTSTPTVGHHLIVAISAWHAGGTDPTISSVTDSGGNSYQKDAEVAAHNVGGRWVTSIFSCKVTTASGTFTVTVTPTTTSANYMTCGVVEVSGLGPTKWLHQWGVNSDVAATDPTVTADVANTQAAALVIACTTDSAADTNVNLQDPPTGYTTISVNQDSNATVGHQASYRLVSAIEMSACSWTCDNTSQDGWTAIVATYLGTQHVSGVSIN